MARALEDPSHDPHGSPIPTSAGEIEAFEFLTLAEAPLGVEVEIREVRDDDSERLRDMERKGLVPGATVDRASARPDGRPRYRRGLPGRSPEARSWMRRSPRRIYVAET